MADASTITEASFASIESYQRYDVEPIIHYNYITVKFTVDNNKVYTQSYEAESTIFNVKFYLMEVFNIPARSMVLSFEDYVLPDHTKIKTLDPEGDGIVELHLKSSNREHHLNVDYAYRDCTVKDVITVRLHTLEEGIKEIAVEIEHLSVEKPFLGGYINTLSGLEYHHGFTQTGPPRPKVPPERKHHRDTQTIFTRNRTSDMHYSRATQMSKPECWISSITDRILIAKPYETAEELKKRLDVEGKVCVIQRYFRAWKMKVALKKISAEYHKRVRLQLQRERHAQTEDMQRKKRDLISRVFPRTAADFSMLYAMTERWKKAEIARIKHMHCGPAKIAEFYRLLEKEIEILQSIDALRQKMRKDRKIQKEIDFFQKIGNPIKWFSPYKNVPIQLDTAETQQGRKYKELYERVCDKTQTREEKILVMAGLKAELEPHNCQLSAELIVLIERISEMLARGFSQKDVDMLQMRIESLLLQHFKLPECNEGVTKRTLVRAERAMKQNLFYCQGCHKLKSIEAYNLNVRMIDPKICSTCKFIDRSKEPWIDVSPYRFILRQIRRFERTHHSISSIAFILKDSDIYFIVTHIWHGRSALSECDDIYKLRLCRWDSQNDWSPWNCILLTAKEALAHGKIPILEHVYDENFLCHIFTKHALAKEHFAEVMIVENRISVGETDDV